MRRRDALLGERAIRHDIERSEEDGQRWRRVAGDPGIERAARDVQPRGEVRAAAEHIGCQPQCLGIGRTSSHGGRRAVIVPERPGRKDYASAGKQPGVGGCRRAGQATDGRATYDAARGERSARRTDVGAAT